MSALAQVEICEEQAQPRRDRRPCDLPGRGVTLGQLLARAREAVEAEGSADCPICGAAMHRAALAAECGGCGSRLS